jgi:hypothetical protein
MGKPSGKAASDDSTQNPFRTAVSMLLYKVTRTAAGISSTNKKWSYITPFHSVVVFSPPRAN